MSPELLIDPNNKSAAKSPEREFSLSNPILINRDELLSLMENAHYVPKGKIEEVRPEVGSHSNDVLLIECVSNKATEHTKKSSNIIRFFTIYYEDKPFLAIFKPKQGESNYMLGSYNISNMFLREVAAYEVDYLGKMGVVPPTVIKEIEIDDRAEIGSLQFFIPPALADIPKLVPELSWEKLAQSSSFRRMAILDRLIINCDRNDTNILAYTNGENGCFGIDHGTSFCSTKKNDVRIPTKYFMDHPEEATLRAEEREMLIKMLKGKEQFIQNMKIKGLDHLFVAQPEDMFEVINLMLQNNNFLIPFKIYR